MKRAAGPFLLAAVLVLVMAVYLWAALMAPVVLWSDSQVDLGWVKAGLGIFRPIPPPLPETPIGHLPKPGYLLFLRLAMSVIPSLGETRSIVVVQSVLLALSILGTSLWIARRRGLWVGLALAVSGLLFLRVRDSSSAVMSEALAAALLLPIGAAILEQPRWRASGALLGLACGSVFLVRPNCGGTVLLIAIFVFAAARENHRLLFLLAGFAVLVLPFWYAGRANLPGDPLHGLGYQIVEGSTEYYWAPSITRWPVGETPGESAAQELQLARENWKKTLSATEPDRNREIVWRAFHGILGIEFYDSRWSEPYGRASTASRRLSPILTLAAIAVVLAAPWREGRGKLSGVLLLFLLVGQDLVLGSNPRYALPLLPTLFLFALDSAGPLLRRRSAHRIAAVVFLVALISAAAWQRQVLDWQWGKIDAPGVKIFQSIPKGALPASEPATLHLRVASPLVPAAAGLDVFTGGQLLYSSATDPSRHRPFITIPLPAWLLKVNREFPVELTLVSHGNYDAISYLIFPVIPPTWAPPAYRQDSLSLSLATGIHQGSLDYWSHQGWP